MFKPTGGVGIGDVFKASVFGFLSFAGFEAAATLGEETRDPRRSIPRAILGVAVFGGIYFIFVTAVEMMGFGTSPAGVAAFASSGSLLGDLGSVYVTSSLGDIVTAGTAISAFGCVIACVVGATRILYALSRDGLGTPALGTVHEKTGTPVRALTVVTAAAAIIILGYRVLFTTSLFNVFLWSGVIGTLILLVAYILATLGAIRLLWFSGPAKSPIWQVDHSGRSPDRAARDDLLQRRPGRRAGVPLDVLHRGHLGDRSASSWSWPFPASRDGSANACPRTTGSSPRSSRARRSTRRTRQATDRCSDLTAYAA